MKKRITFRKEFPGLLFLVILFMNLPARQPDFKFEYLTMENGLSQSSINCILQDSTGFLWFGTQDGLNRYDGYEFQVFSHNPLDADSLSNNWVEAMVETEPGVLWVGTLAGGLNRFDTINKKITRFKHTPGDKNGLSHNSVRALLKDSAGFLWIGTHGGMDRIDLVSGTFTHYRPIPGDPASLSHAQVTAIYEDRGGTLWVGTLKGLNRFDRQSGNFTRFVHGSRDPESLSGDSITAITGDQKGNLWVGTRNNGLNCLCPGQKEFRRFKHHPGAPTGLCSNTVKSLLVDAAGTLWVGTGDSDNQGNGLSHLVFNNTNSKWTWTHYSYRRHGTATSVPSPYLSDRTILSIHEDRGGSLWFGSYLRGINKLNKRRAKFHHYTHDPDNPAGLNDDSVYCFQEDDAGNLWIGTYSGGLNRFDRENNRFIHYDFDTDTPANLRYYNIWRIFADRSGQLWLGTGSSGVIVFNPETGIFKPFIRDPDDPFRNNANTITAIMEDSSGHLWLGAWNQGLYLVDRETKKFYHYPIDPTAVKTENVNSIHEDKQKTLWLATYGQGLVKATHAGADGEKPVTLDFLSYTHKEGVGGGISSDYLNFILETKTGGKEYLWLGTTHGLNRFDKETGAFTCFTEAHGLSNNNVYGIVSAGEDLWLSSNGGLSQFNTRTLTFRNYDTGDGVQGMEFNSGSCFKSRDGKIFFGGVNGFNTFFPGSVPRNPNIPPIVITRVNTFDTPLTLPRAAYAMDRIQLSYKDRFFSFEFAALDYENPGKNRYAYKLEGVNDDWIECGNRRYAGFSSLTGGEFVFRVKGSNNDDVWNEEGTAIHVSITPPFFHTWWFRMPAAALVILLFLLVLRFRTRHLEHKMEKELLEKELKLKADYTAMLVHDLRNPLQCIIGYSELQEGEPDPANVDYYAGHIKQSSRHMLQLINDMLDISKFEAGKMTIHRESTELKDIIGRNIRLMEPLLSSNKNRFELHLDPLPAIDADPVRLSQVFNNLLSNAVKFSPEAGVITVTAKMVRENDGEFQEVSVEDRGPGIAPEKQAFIFSKYAQIESKSEAAVKGTGLGLAVSRLIIEAHNGTIAYRPNTPTGSIFYFRIPNDNV